MLKNFAKFLATKQGLRLTYINEWRFSLLVSQWDRLMKNEG
jgi:hypothetical protein